MKKLTPGSILCWLCGLLMILLWHFSQKSWSGLSGGIFLSGSRPPTMDSYISAEGFGTPLMGVDYYFGGSLILLFGAAWMIVPQFKLVPAENAPGPVPLLGAAAGIVALGRWYRDYRTHAAPVESSQQHTVVYAVHDAAINCMAITLALALLGIVYWILQRRAAKPAA